MKFAIAVALPAWIAGAALYVAQEAKAKKAEPPAVKATTKAVDKDAKTPLDNVFLAEPPRREAPAKAAAPQGASDDVEAALDQPTILEFSETPLSQALKFLAVQHNIRCYVDEAGLANAMVDREQPVTMQMQGVRFGLGLDLLLEPLNLDYCIRENILFISSKDNINWMQETAVLRIGDILPGVDNAAEHIDASAERIVKTITDNVDSHHWVPNGGLANIQFVSDARSLVVTANTRTLRKATKLLEELRAAKVAMGEPDKKKNASKIAAR